MVPSPETLSGYEKLGIIGILLLVICVGLVVIVWAVRQLRSVATAVLSFVTQITQALTEVKDSLDCQDDARTRLHERLDHVLSCTRSGCPLFNMRKAQQKDAARAASGNPVPDHPSQINAS